MKDETQLARVSQLLAIKAILGKYRSPVRRPCMLARIRTSFLCTAFFLAGTVVSAQVGSAGYDFRDLPFRGTHCDRKLNCQDQQLVTTEGMSDIPAFPEAFKYECRQFEDPLPATPSPTPSPTPKPGASLAPVPKSHRWPIPPIDIGPGILNWIDITRERNAYGIVATSAQLTQIEKHQRALIGGPFDVKPPYVFVALERCTDFPQSGSTPEEKRITTQILRIPVSLAQAAEVTVETRRNAPR